MKTTVYLNKTAEELLKRAKEYDPDYSVSIAAEEGLKQFVEKKNIQFTGMKEEIAKKGTYSSEEFYGSQARFNGRKLAHERIAMVGQDTYEYQTLYLTKKGKYLVQITTVDERDGEQVLDYYICHTLKELQGKASPILLTKAGKTPGEFLPDLDI